MRIRNYKTLAIAVVILSAFVFLNFSDENTSGYQMMNDKVIKRMSDGALYIKGVINIKFKNDINSATSTKTGVSNVDGILDNYSVKKVEQSYPLNRDFTKRKIGDEQLARIYQIYYDANIDPFELSKEVFESNKDMLDWAEPEFVMLSDFVPNDPSYASQWHLSKIQAALGWDLSQGDTNVKIGICDSGSDLDHPDLQANIKRNWAENPTNGVDDDANGYVDDWIGWDFAGANYQTLIEDNDPQIYGTNCEHGSHVSGCASEVTNNAIGGAGIGFKCKLFISKHGADNDYTGGGYSYMYKTNNGLIYLYQNGAKVINCSFGSASYSAQTQLIVNNAYANGTVIVASAGNDGQNAPRYPASYDNVVSVAATNSSDQKAWFSNYHSTVDVCAPGENIYATVWNNTYTSMDGTSMSAPITSGLVALIFSKFPSYTPDQAVNKLKSTTDNIYGINPGYVGLLGTGRINAYNALLGGDTLIADFTANQTTIPPGGSVNFTDMSTGGPTTWSWTFTGGNPGTSTTQNPTNIVYSAIGSYTVSLTVTKNMQSSTRTKPNYITVSPGSSYRLNESFENTNFPPTGWIKINPTGGTATGWTRLPVNTSPVPGFYGGSITAPAGGGNAVAFCNYITGNANNGSSGPCDQWLITPQLTNIQPTDSLTFWLRKFGNYVENFSVKISTTTPTVAAMTINVMTQNFPASDSGWVQYKYNIGSLVPPGSNIYIGFREYVNDVAIDGASFSMDLVKVTMPTTGITINGDEIPKTYSLSQNYPNPFNPTTNIKFGLPKASNVKIVVYNIKGQEVAVLLDEYKQAGTFTYMYNANGLASGIYFYRITAGDFTETKKMTLIK